MFSTGLSTEGLVKGEQQCLWQDVAIPLLMVGHLSRGTVRVRGPRVTSISSVWTTEKALGEKDCPASKTNLMLLVGRL